jgi:hypothetical protein
MKRIVACAWICAVIGACGSADQKSRTYPVPTAADLVGKIEAAQHRLVSFSAESTMDYWLGSDRVKGTVLIMGTPASQVLFHALSPAGGSVMIELSCSGDNFAMIDHQNDCQLAGPCSGGSIAQFLHIAIEPRDFFLLALGQTPLLSDHAVGNVEQTVTWNSSSGLEELTLRSASASQLVTIDARDGRFDIRKSELRDAANRLVWMVENTEHEATTDDAGAQFRMPTVTRFRSGESDLRVQWDKRRLNMAIDPAKFVLTVSPSVRRCDR